MSTSAIVAKHIWDAISVDICPGQVRTCMSAPLLRNKIAGERDRTFFSKVNHHALKVSLERLGFFLENALSTDEWNHGRSHNLLLCIHS